MDHAGELWGDDGQPGDDVGEPGDHVVEEPGEDVEELVEGDPPGDLASGEGASSEPPGDSLRFDRWRRRSAAGAMMTGIAFGMQEALDRKRKEAPIVQQLGGDPGPDGPIELRFDPDHPEKTVAVVRPWLMDGGGAEPDDTDGTAAPADR